VLAAAGLLPAASPSFRYERRAVIGAPNPHGLPVDVSSDRLCRSVSRRTRAGGTVRRRARGGSATCASTTQGREVPHLLVDRLCPRPSGGRPRRSCPSPTRRRRAASRPTSAWPRPSTDCGWMGFPPPF
jgi:hypothetical protein